MMEKFVVTPKKNQSDNYAVISLRLEKQLLEKYDEVSALSGRSRNDLLCMALQYALENLEFSK